MKEKWDFYKDANGKWRWRRIASNGKIIGASSQGYTSKANCIDNAKKHGYSG